MPCLWEVTDDIQFLSVSFLPVKYLQCKGFFLALQGQLLALLISVFCVDGRNIFWWAAPAQTKLWYPAKQYNCEVDSVENFSFFPHHCGSHITLTPAGWAQGSLWNLAFVNVSQSSAWALGFQNKCKSWKFGCNNSKFLACMFAKEWK